METDSITITYDTTPPEEEEGGRNLSYRYALFVIIAINDAQLLISLESNR